MPGIHPVTRIDLAFSLFCLRHRFNQQVASVSKLVSRSGDGPLYGGILLFCWYIGGETGQAILYAALVAFAIELPVYWLTKNSFRRRRPHEISTLLTNFITPSDRYSLPSGHTAAAFLMATILAAFFPEWSWWCYGWAALVGMSRILLGVHFLTDIVIGALLGSACAYYGLHLMSGAMA